MHGRFPGGMTIARESRFAAVREQLRRIRYAIAAAAVALFGAVFVAARAAHPASGSASNGTVSSTVDDESDDFSFGDGSVSPSFGAAPTMGTHSS
jgi:hypothetical protein